MRNTYLNQNFNAPPSMRRRVGEVLDEVNKDQRAACAVKHRDLPHDARALHEHLVDFTDPVGGGHVTEQAIIFQAGAPALDAGTDPCLRPWKRGLRGGCVHVVEISGSDYMADRSKRRDFFGDRCSDVAWRMQHKLARGEADYRHSCLEPRTRQSNRICAEPYLIHDIGREGHRCPRPLERIQGLRTPHYRIVQTGPLRDK